MDEVVGRVVVLGGTRSGKSAYAQSLLGGAPSVTYLATGPTGDGDPEWRARVERHQRARPAGWRTVESTDLAGALRGGPDALRGGPHALRGTPDALLVDSVTTWLTAVLDQAGAWNDRPGWADAVGRRVDDLLDAWRARHAPAVLVTDEVGWGVVPPTPAGRLFRDRLGLLNQGLAAGADAVWLVVAGIPTRLR